MQRECRQSALLLTTELGVVKGNPTEAIQKRVMGGDEEKAQRKEGYKIEEVSSSVDSKV